MSDRDRPRGSLSERRQLAGVEEIDRALGQGATIRLLLVRRGASDPAVVEVADRARSAGLRVLPASANDLRRMSRTREPAEVLALAGPDPGAPAERVLDAASAGLVWLLVGVRYPGNAGFAIRTAEVSGARGVFLDTAFDNRARKQALRTSMGADRFFPVFWEGAARVIEQARSAGRAVTAVEDVGDRAPWEVDLTPSTLCLIGGEERGIPTALLDRCDAVVRIPMAGFVPSYNLQAAMAMVAGEHRRQMAWLDARGAAPGPLAADPGSSRSSPHS